MYKPSLAMISHSPKHDLTIRDGIKEKTINSEFSKGRSGKVSPHQLSSNDMSLQLREQYVNDVLNKGAASASASLANILGFSLESKQIVTNSYGTRGSGLGQVASMQ